MATKKGFDSFYGKGDAPKIRNIVFYYCLTRIQAEEKKILLEHDEYNKNVYSENFEVHMQPQCSFVCMANYQNGRNSVRIFMEGIKILRDYKRHLYTHIIRVYYSSFIASILEELRSNPTSY